MLMENMDEALEIKPTVTVEGKQLELLKLESASTGQKFQLSAVAEIVSVNEEKGADGITFSRVTFELGSINLEAPEADLAGFFPNSTGA